MIELIEEGTGVIEEREESDQDSIESNGNNDLGIITLHVVW
jgi:hypothetical protein